ncbi:hypothetical protein KDH_69530 [Dictyobacter sp. S3.2.2.5]|uniref:Uncharacterized protein n=1 Tax=Dictyobacter halimunensis TaxID=3026934 RepID=A0ABQ6G0V8_9CHLR|nr:hypothetical protein KDH_69530 [Dictyobacter sp. S3.2.2.5]
MLRSGRCRIAPTELSGRFTFCRCMGRYIYEADNVRGVSSSGNHCTSIGMSNKDHGTGDGSESLACHVDIIR